MHTRRILEEIRDLRIESRDLRRGDTRPDKALFAPIDRLLRGGVAAAT